jgi:hypothetical protein
LFQKWGKSPSLARKTVSAAKFISDQSEPVAATDVPVTVMVYAPTSVPRLPPPPLDLKNKADEERAAEQHRFGSFLCFEPKWFPIPTSPSSGSHMA